MRPGIHELSKTGMSKRQIAEIVRSDDREIWVRLLRKHRYELLDEIHKKQQSLDVLDLMVSRLRG